MSLPSTRTRLPSWPRAPTRSACRWKSAASEYGSSPDEQPALHTLIAGDVALPQRRHDLLGDRAVRLPVPEELRDVDRQRVEQLVVLGAVAVEDARVVGVGVHPAGAHAHGDAPAQALVLVARAAEAAVAGDLRGQLREARVGRARSRHRTCRTASRLVRTIALSGSSSSACSQQRTASSRSCRLKRMLPSLRYTSSPSVGLSLMARW